MKLIKKIIAVNFALLIVVSFINMVIQYEAEAEENKDKVTVIHRLPPIEAVVVSNCTSESLSQEIVPVLEQCRIDCGAQCQYCGQVYTFCLEGGFLARNYSQDACNIVILDYIPSSPSCPFLTSLESCCNSTIPPPPSPPVSLECTNQTNLDIVYERLLTCQDECGSLCTICGQVWNYCKQRDFLDRSLNYTVEACAVLTLDSIPTLNGICPFNSTLEQCCYEQPLPPVVAPIEPPVTPPVEPPVGPPVTPPVVYDCSDETAVEDALVACQQACDTDCTFCSDVFDYCVTEQRLEANSTLTNCTTGFLSGIPTSSGLCPFEVVIVSCCSPPAPPVTPPPEIVCGTTDLPTYAVADACLSQAGSCSSLAIQCSSEILDVVNQDVPAYDCISTFIGLQSVNCQNGLATGYTTCCNSTVPEPEETPVCPLTTSNVLTAYECISRDTTGPTCFDRVDTCDVFLNALTNETVSTDCLNATVSDSTNLDDCDFFTNLVECCNSTVPVPPVEPPVDVPAEPVAPVAPPVEPPVQPPFPPPTAQCTNIDSTTYQALVSCFQGTSGTCAQKANVDCASFISGIGTTVLANACIRQGTNTSTDAVDCDIETVVQNCCSPQAGQLCPPPLGEGEAFSVFNAGTDSTVASFGYVSPGNLTVVGNVGWSNSIFQGPTVATVTGVRLGGQSSTLADINNAISTIVSLPSTGTFPSSISGSTTTFLPGVYKNTASITIFPNAIITLNAQSNPYAVFIFYSSLSINYGNNVQILLINGAHPSNVYFVTSTQQTVGSNTVFNGNFIKSSGTNSNLGGNNIITGRLLSVGSGFRVGSGFSTIMRLPNLKNPTC